MEVKKGFTMIEIIVVMIIVGILAAVAIPNFTTAMVNARMQAAEHNLMAIAAAQQKYYEDHGYYCGMQIAPNPNNYPNGCQSGNVWSVTASVNQGLGLNIPPPQTYPGGDPDYYCDAFPSLNPPSYVCDANNGGGPNAAGGYDDIFFSIQNSTAIPETPSNVLPNVVWCRHQTGYLTFTCP